MATPLNIDLIIDAALTAPSGDNCQPWKFGWDGHTLAIRYDAERGRHDMNHRDLASYLSLGTVLELIRIAASVQGFEAKAEIRGLDADLRFEASDIAPDELYPMIPQRTTDRRKYQGGTLDPLLFSEDLKRFPGCELRVKSDHTPRYVAYHLKCEEYLSRNGTAFLDFIAWIRFNRAEAEMSRDGMVCSGLGVGLLEVFGLWILRRIPGLFPVFRALGLPFKSRMVGKAQLRSSAAVLALATRTATPQSLIEIGGLGLRVWLRLCGNGYGVQPLTVLSLYAFDAAMEEPPPSASADFREAFRQGREILSENFAFSADAIPAWAFRVGLSPPLPARTRTLRLTRDQAALKRT